MLGYRASTETAYTSEVFRRSGTECNTGLGTESHGAPGSNLGPTTSERPGNIGKETAGKSDKGPDRGLGPSDTTADTTQRATPRNSGQPRAKRIGLSKPVLQHRATPGNRYRRIVAPKVAGSSPVGHPRGFGLLKRNTRKAIGLGFVAGDRWQQYISRTPRQALRSPRRPRRLRDGSKCPSSALWMNVQVRTILSSGACAD